MSVAGVPTGRALIVQRARDLLEEAKKYGYSRDDLIDVLKELP
ncbi:hypothetical protein [Nonomuraea recticatena]